MPVPNKAGRKLVLSEAEWLALSHDLDRHAMADGDLQNNCPFLYHHLSVINDRMLKASGVKESEDLEEHPSYEEWYENNEQCDDCGKYMPKVGMKTVDGDNFCHECFKEEEK